MGFKFSVEGHAQGFYVPLVASHPCYGKPTAGEGRPRLEAAVEKGEGDV